jgi:hypothetical protein
MVRVVGLAVCVRSVTKAHALLVQRYVLCSLLDTVDGALPHTPLLGFHIKRLVCV